MRKIPYSGVPNKRPGTLIDFEKRPVIWHWLWLSFIRQASFSFYSRVPNKRPGTIINFGKIFHPGRLLIFKILSSKILKIRFDSNMFGSILGHFLKQIPQNMKLISFKMFLYAWKSIDF